MCVLFLQDPQNEEILQGLWKTSCGAIRTWGNFYDACYRSSERYKFSELKGERVSCEDTANDSISFEGRKEKGECDIPYGLCRALCSSHRT